jgi:hypothetical protein
MERNPLEAKDGCDVCRDEPAVGVACVPGMPVSVAYGRKCLEANAHPYGLMVANTALIGKYADTAPWWQEMVTATLTHLGKSREEFDAAVAEQAAEFEKEMAEADAQVERLHEAAGPHPDGCLCPGCSTARQVGETDG